MRRTRPIPFALVAPASIILFGAAVTTASTLLGLEELSVRAERAAALRSATLADALSARLEESSPEAWGGMISRASSTCQCTLLVVDQEKTVLHAAPQQPLAQSALAALTTQGVVRVQEESSYYTQSSAGRTGERVVAIVPLVDITDPQNALISSMVAFASLLLAAAGFVGWALARDVHADVLYVRDAIVSMAESRGPPRIQAIPVRTIDQVGELTASFNTLLERFQAAERAYRQDLAQAKSFDKDRAAFLSALSHELRTPLNAILGFADVLLDEIDGPLSEEARENLTIVRTSGEHLRSLIDDILALSALESGEFRLSREQLDLAEVAAEVVTEARVIAEQKKLHLELVTPESKEVTTAYADRRRMRQVFGNVISNAVKFTSVGSIKVTLFREGDNVVTEVTDTGPGIAEEQLEAIFEEFRQADTAGAHRMGTGLGLSITRRLVQMHGGTVRASSKLGDGSTLTIRIPVEEPTTRGVTPLVLPPGNTIIREV